jgi:hypothetical protein
MCSWFISLMRSLVSFNMFWHEKPLRGPPPARSMCDAAQYRNTLQALHKSIDMLFYAIFIVTFGG